MIRRTFDRFLNSRRCTLLGVGPMSLNCVNAAIDLANEADFPLMLIASRRQIDSEEFGGGYVNNWTTRTFAEHVKKRDRRGRILLCRDHGGPWQNPSEISNSLSLRLAMDSAKHSLKADIDAGFDLLHLDTSMDIFSSPSKQDVLDRLFEMYEFCWNHAKSDRPLMFEVGTEEQSGTAPDSIADFRLLLESISATCSAIHLPQPTFVVVQTGTKVLETRNVGSLDSPFRIIGELPAEIQVPKILEVCNSFQIYLKEHNADYLSDQSLAWHPKLGIHSINVAPEFGVVETRTFLHLLESFSLTSLADEFLELSYQSRKWEKWMAPDTNATDRDRAIISGHYVFSRQEFASIKERAQAILGSHVSIDERLSAALRESILRYARLLRLV